MSAKPAVPPSEWGCDHWTVLAYAFTCLGTSGGRVALARLRLDGRVRPTQVRGGRVLPGHSDLDCLADAVAAGVLTSALRSTVHFTDQGLKLGQWLCRALFTRAVAPAELTWAQALAASGADFSSSAEPAPAPAPAPVLVPDLPSPLEVEEPHDPRKAVEAAIAVVDAMASLRAAEESPAPAADRIARAEAALAQATRILDAHRARGQAAAVRARTLPPTTLRALQGARRR